MDVCRSLELDVRWQPALGRRASPWVAGGPAPDTTLIGEIRALDDASDVALRGLLDVASRDRCAVEVAIVALLPLVVSRCRHSRDRVDEFIGELAIVIAEAARDGLPRSGRRVANVLVDRAWGRVRGPGRRVREPVAVDALDVGSRLAARGPDPAEMAVDRVMIDGLVAGLRARRSSHRSVVRAWNMAVGLAEVREPSRSDRARLKYARQVLRRSVAADLVG